MRGAGDRCEFLRRVGISYYEIGDIITPDLGVSCHWSMAVTTGGVIGIVGGERMYNTLDNAATAGTRNPCIT